MEHTLADLSRARAELGYQPSVRLREGLERTIHHILEQEPRAARALRTPPTWVGSS
jgi:nucleoside-diphosphate-sugar epimerase